jgi:hypothetical protein
VVVWLVPEELDAGLVGVKPPEERAWLVPVVARDCGDGALLAVRLVVSWFAAALDSCERASARDAVSPAVATVAAAIAAPTASLVLRSAGGFIFWSPVGRRRSPHRRFRARL